MESESASDDLLQDRSGLRGSNLEPEVLLEEGHAASVGSELNDLRAVGKVLASPCSGDVEKCDGVDAHAGAHSSGELVRAVAQAAAASGATGGSLARPASFPSVMSLRRNGVRSTSTTPTTRLPQPSSMKSFE